MTTDTTARLSYKFALILFVGILASGLPANLLVNVLYPQPEWLDIETYASNFHPLQMIPFWGGFVMLIGFTGMIVSIHYSTIDHKRVYTMLAVACSIAYATLISLNYMLQLSVLQPNVQDNHLEGMIYLVFANPHSITLTIEMLGYGFQGTAAWLVASFFDPTPLGRSIKYLSIINGVGSVAGTFFQALNIPMVVDDAFGMIVFYGWNILFTALCFLYLIYFRKKSKHALPPL